VLSDEHRQALLDGRRMARHRRAVEEGRARELLAPSPSQAVGLPRLVKRATWMRTTAGGEMFRDIRDGDVRIYKPPCRRGRDGILGRSAR